MTAYYHIQNLQGCADSFERYYWLHGHHIDLKICRCHALWGPVPGPIYVSALERLKTAFAEERRALGAFLDLSLSNARIAAIAGSTAIERRQRRQQTPSGRPWLMRGGHIGDRKTHLTPMMITDLERIPHEGLTPTSLGLRLRLQVKDSLDH